MPTFVIAHGSLKTGKDQLVTVGESVVLEQSFVDEVDPAGVTFVTEEKWLALEQVKELNERIAAMSDAEKLEALTKALAPGIEETPSKKSRRGSQSEG